LRWIVCWIKFVAQAKTS